MRLFRLPFRLARPSGFAARVALLYAAIFVLVGVQLPFFPLWLKANGLDAGMIGIVLAAPMLVRVVAVPAVSRIADRMHALRGMVMACAAATLIGYMLLAVAPGPIAIVAAYVLASAAYSPVFSLSETYALRGLAARNAVYGPVRLWGSAAFVAATLAAGVIADFIPARDLIWPIVAAVLLNVAAAYTLEPMPAASLAREAPVAKKMLRDPAFLCVLLAASLIQASHAVYYGFSSLNWVRDGLSGSTIGALWGLGVVGEIALFAFQGRLRFSPATFMMIGAVGAVVRWIGMAFDPPFVLLPLLQLLHALSFCATHIGSLSFVARYAPPSQAASAQGYLGVALGVVMAASMSLSGWLYGSFGSLAYVAMALVAAAGGVGAIVANKLGRHAPG